MTNQERLIVKKLWKEEITKDEFLKEFTYDIETYKDYFEEILEKAYTERNKLDIGDILYLGFVFDLFEKNHVNILIKLIKSDWHERHEDIVSIFHKLKAPDAIEVLYQTILTKFDYLAYDNCASLIRKCCFALAAINTNESWEKIEILTKSKNDDIRKSAIEQINILNGLEE